MAIVNGLRVAGAVYRKDAAGRAFSDEGVDPKKLAD
jgi:hypothetical protein